MRPARRAADIACWCASSGSSSRYSDAATRCRATQSAFSLLSVLSSPRAPLSRSRASIRSGISGLVMARTHGEVRGSGVLAGFAVLVAIRGTAPAAIVATLPATGYGRFSPPPSTDASRHHPSRDASRHHPSTDASRHHPSTDASRHHPSTDASRHHPNTDASRHHPSTDASRHHPSTDASRHHPSTDASRHHPSTDASRHHPSRRFPPPDGASRHHPSTDASRHHPSTDASRHHPSTDASRHHPSTDASRHHPSTDASRHHPNRDASRHHPSTDASRHHPSTDASRHHPSTDASDRSRTPAACRRDPGTRRGVRPGRNGRQRCDRFPATGHRLVRPAWGVPDPPSRASNRSRFSCRVWSPHRTQPYCGRRWNGPLTRNGHPSSGGHSSMNVRRCPTLPQGRPCSTIGAASLSFRVRNVSGRFPRAMAAETRATPTLPHRGWVGCVVSVSRTGPDPLMGSGGCGCSSVLCCGVSVCWEPQSGREQSRGHSHGLSMNDLQTCVSVVIVKLSAY